MVGRPGPRTERALADGERLVEDEAAGNNRLANGLEQIALQVSCDQHKVEPGHRQWRAGQIRAPASERQALARGAQSRIFYGVGHYVHAEGSEPAARENQGVSAPAHGDIQRAFRARDHRLHSRHPFHHERRRRDILRVVAQALLTAVGIGVLGLLATAVLGFRAGTSAEVGRHIVFGIFSTCVTLLAHSMMMFYLIGKGKAVKDAMVEGGRAGAEDPEFRKYVGRIAAARRPVFLVATLAMAVTIVAAIIGASVDTGMLPPMVHAMIGYGAIAFNLAALRAELSALSESSRVVDEVNRLLGS